MIRYTLYIGLSLISITVDQSYFPLLTTSKKSQEALFTIILFSSSLVAFFWAHHLNIDNIGQDRYLVLKGIRRFTRM